MVCSRLQNFLPPHHASIASQGSNAPGPGNNVLEEGDDSSKSSKQSSRKSSSVVASQSKSILNHVSS